MTCWLTASVRNPKERLQLCRSRHAGHGDTSAGRSRARVRLRVRSPISVVMRQLPTGAMASMLVLALNMEVRMPSQTTNRARRFLKMTGVAFVVPLLAALGQAPVAAAEMDSSITVKADQATLVALEGDPATVVIGNALFADVSLEKGMIVIHGRQFGTTNVIVLDKDNTELANFELHVVRGGSQNLTIYKAGSAYSHVCAPVCESALQVGDNAEHFNNVNSAMSTKLGLSMGAGK